MNHTVHYGRRGVFVTSVEIKRANTTNYLCFSSFE
jgi:hypothetical protein